MSVPAQQRQRVCPHCATIAVTHERSCPWCKRSYVRRAAPWLLALALIQTAVVIGAVALLLVSFGDTLDSRLDDAVTDVQNDFSGQLDDLDAQVRRELRRELDARFPTGATGP